MSYTVSDFVACPTIQRELNEHFAINQQPEYMREPMPFFEYVMSPANRGTLSQEVNPGDSKVRTVRVRYNRRMLESTVAQNQTNPTCTASTVEGDAYTDYTIDTTKNFQIERKINLVDLIDRCQRNEDYYVSLIRRMINALVTRVATQTALEGYALAGEWGSDVNATTTVTNDQLIVNTLKAGSTDDLAPFTLQKIQVAAQQTGYSDAFATFGGTTLKMYLERMMSGCCSDDGVDLGNLQSRFGFAGAYDRRIASVMGGEAYSLMIMRGALQMLTYNLFEGMTGLNVIESPTYNQRVIVDPISGLPIDMVTKYDCGALHIVMTATTKLVGLPSDIFQNGDILAGVNFVNMIKVVNS